MYYLLYRNKKGYVAKLSFRSAKLGLAFLCCGAILALFLQACQSKSTSKTVVETKQDSVGAKDITAAPNPLTTYWENYDFQNLEAINDPEKGEQLFVDFIYRFPQHNLQTVADGIEAMLDKAQVNPEVFAFFAAQYEKYLYDPNSPMRNDLYYEPVLVYLVNSHKLSAEEQVKKETLLKLIRKNQVGTQAADFDFVQQDGKPGKLSQLEAPLTLLFFYEPGCSHCEEAITALGPDALLNDMIARQFLKVLAVYPFGGRSIWQDYEAKVPHNWLNVFDAKEAVVKGEKYDLKATPTIFLLDADKRVLLKDTDVQQLLGFLQAQVR